MVGFSVRAASICMMGSSDPDKSGSEKLRERGADALGTGCPKTPLLSRSQVTDSMCPEFPALDAHKELVLGSCPATRLGLNRFAVFGSAASVLPERITHTTVPV